MTAPKRLAFFGGSFNPIHNAHVLVAEELLKTFSFDTVWVVPTANPPHKTLEYSAQDRLTMAHLAFEHTKEVTVSDIEILASQQGPVYSFNTLTTVQKTHPQTQIFFVLGEDAFDYLPHWYRFPEVLGLCSFLVITRPGAAPFSKTLATLEGQGLVKPATTIPSFANKACPQAFETNHGTQVLLWPLKTPDISATQVRALVQSGGDISTLVPAVVSDYLKSVSVYGTG